jgi:hypothetical protein
VVPLNKARSGKGSSLSVRSSYRLDSAAAAVDKFLLNVTKWGSLGKSEEQLFADVCRMFTDITDITQLGKAAYYGTLKGVGTGETTLCEMLRFVCWKRNVLPVSVSIHDVALDGWQAVYGDVGSFAAEKLHFALSITARILYDRFYNDAAAALVVDPTDSSSLGIVRKLMKRARSDLALFLTDLDLPEM